MSGERGDNRVLLIFRFRGQRKSIKQSVIDLYVVTLTQLPYPMNATGSTVV